MRDLDFVGTHFRPASKERVAVRARRGAEVDVHRSGTPGVGQSRRERVHHGGKGIRSCGLEGIGSSHHVTLVACGGKRDVRFTLAIHRGESLKLGSEVGGTSR